MAEQDPAPTTIDLDALDLGPMARHARTATFAPNWKLVLAADGLVGLLIVGVGIAASFWIAPLGWVILVLGAFYLFLVLRRSLQWRWLRRRAGLPTGFRTPESTRR